MECWDLSNSHFTDQFIDKYPYLLDFHVCISVQHFEGKTRSLKGAKRSLIPDFRYSKGRDNGDIREINCKQEVKEKEEVQEPIHSPHLTRKYY